MPPPGYVVGVRVPREKLIGWGLAVLAENADRAAERPILRGPGLRLVLALLYEYSDGTRAPFDAYWQGCVLPAKKGDEARSGILRSRTLWQAYYGILVALGGSQPEGLEDMDTRRRRWRAALRPDRLPRSGLDTRMQAPTKSCGWL